MPAKPNYKSFRQFNKTPIPSLAHSRSSVTTPMTARVFNSDSLQDRYVRELALEKTLPVKEVLESFEFLRGRANTYAPGAWPTSAAATG